jgi:hypothetical protein
MKETRFIEVGPDEVNKIIDVWATFGWELLGAPQEINYSTTHRTQETDDHYSSEYTTTTNYVKITFQRDKEIKNYSQLASFQSDYEAVPRPGVPPSRFGIFKLFGIPIWIIVSIIGLLLYVVPGVLIIIWRCVSYSKKNKQWDAEYDNMIKKREEILEKARSLS